MTDEEICRRFIDISQFISILLSSLVKFGILLLFLKSINSISHRFSHLLHS